MADTRNSTMTPSRYKISKYSSGYLSLYFTYTFERRALFVTCRLSENVKYGLRQKGKSLLMKRKLFFVNTKP